MSRLRVLVFVSVFVSMLASASAIVAAPAAPTPPPTKGTGTASAAPAKPPAPPKLKVGEVLDFATELAQVFPTSGKVRVNQHAGKPMALFFWSTGNSIARDDFAAFDRFVKQEGLRAKMDVYAVGGFSADKGSAGDLKDMATILGIQEVPIIADPDFLLAQRIGAEQFPELCVIGSDGKILAKQIRGIDHGNLQAVTGAGGAVTPMTATAYLKRVALEKTGPSIPRTLTFYPSDRLLTRRYPDTELPLFSPLGWGKGKATKLSSILSGKRPAAVMFFSATCEHCQVDVPQIVKFMKAHPGAIDLVGITRIRSDGHRSVSADYFKQQGIEFPILEDGGNVTDDWQVTSTPTTFYLSPDGAVVSTSYYQHQDLDAEWMKLLPRLSGAPPPGPSPKVSGWNFPMQLQDEAGKTIDLASFAGKPTLLHFWATWCGPCRKELPELLARLPAMQASANIVLATVETDPAVLAKYRKETGLTFKSYLAPKGGLAGKIDFGRSVPRTYLLDEHGRITQVYSGSFEWSDAEKFGRILGRLGS